MAKKTPYKPTYGSNTSGAQEAQKKFEELQAQEQKINLEKQKTHKVLNGISMQITDPYKINLPQAETTSPNLPKVNATQPEYIKDERGNVTGLILPNGE